MSTARVITIAPRSRLQVFEEAAPVEPNTAEFEASADAHWQNAEIESAISLWNNVLSEQPDRFELRDRLAQALLIRGRWEDARREFSMCVPLQPDSTRLIASMAVCCLHTGQARSAATLAEKALRLDADCRLAAAVRDKLAAPANIEAPATADGLLELDEEEDQSPPQDEVCATLMAEAAMLDEAERWEEASQVLADIVLLDPCHAGALFALAETQERLDNRAWAALYYERAIRCAPQEWAAYFNLARLRWQQNVDTEARLLLERVLMLQPEHSGAIRLMAQICELQQDVDEAECWWGRAIELNPQDGESAIGMARIAIQRKNWTAAASYLQLSAELPVAGYEALYNLGLCHWKNGDLQAARDAWQRASSMGQPQHADASLALAALALQCGNHQEAKSQLDHSPDANLFAMLAQEFHRLGQADQAVVCWRNATQANPVWSDAWINLGALARELGNEEEASRAWKRAVELEPELACSYFQ